MLHRIYGAAFFIFVALHQPYYSRMQHSLRIYNQLIDTDSTAVPDGSRPGRNPLYIANRNVLLVHRYYYYTRIKRMPLPDLMPTLTGEFFLSQKQIGIIINAHTDMVMGLKKGLVTVADMRRQFPHFVWP